MSKRPELTFHPEDMQMNNQHMRRCLMSPVIREMQFKTTVRDFPGGKWLRICLAMQETWVQSLVLELRYHTPQSN